jgi:hypothetical protein
MSPTYVGTGEDRIHNYKYNVEDMGKALQLVLEFFSKHPEELNSVVANSGLKIAQAFDDGTDCNEPWDNQDIVHAMDLLGFEDE